MTGLELLIAIVVFGVIFYLVNRFVPMEPVFRTILKIVAVVIAVFLLLAFFGIVHLPFKLF